MEDNLKIIKMEYLSNHWTDLPQISWNEDNLHPQMEDDLHPQMEDDLKILKVEYLSNH